MANNIKTLTSFTMNLLDIPATGDTRQFRINGDIGASFEVEIYDSNGNYYDFLTSAWGGKKRRLTKTLKNGEYSASIVFPTLVTSLEMYTVNVFAKTTPCSITRFTPRIEIRNEDGTINVNKSIGSNSNTLTKVLYQDVNYDLKLSCIAPSLGSGEGEWSGATPSVTSTTGEGTVSLNSGVTNKIPFTISLTAAAGRSITINRQPTVSDMLSVHSVSFGSAPVTIPGEDTVGGTLFYRWPVSTVTGFTNGMVLDSYSTTGANVTPGTSLGGYKTFTTVTTQVQRGCEIIEVSEDHTDVFVPVTETTGDIIISNRQGTPILQPGNLTFDKQQPIAIASDANVRILGYGYDHIAALTKGLRFEVSDLKAEILETDIIKTTTTTDTTTGGRGSRIFPVAELDGILINTSTVSGIGVDPRNVDPTVVDKTAATGAGSITTSSDQHFENGRELTFTGGGKVVTITGVITLLEVPETAVAIYFDVEKFLTAA